MPALKYQNVLDSYIHIYIKIHKFKLFPPAKFFNSMDEKRFNITHEKRKIIRFKTRPCMRHLLFKREKR